MSGMTRRELAMNCQVPPVDDAIETAESAGDGFGSGRLVATGGVARPAAEPSHDPAQPSQTPLRMRIAQLLGPAFKLAEIGRAHV